MLGCWDAENLQKLSACCCTVFLRQTVIRCGVFLLRWLQSATQSSIRCILSKPPPNIFSCRSMWAGEQVASECVRAIWTWCEALHFEFRFLSLISYCLFGTVSPEPSKLFSVFCLLQAELCFCSILFMRVCDRGWRCITSSYMPVDERLGSQTSGWRLFIHNVLKGSYSTFANIC